MVEILVPLGFFVLIGAIWISGIVFGARAKRDLHETARALAERGQPLSPDLLSALHKPLRAADQDLRSGVILTALGIGLALAGAIDAAQLLPGSEGSGAARGFFIAAIIVGAIGIGQMVAWIVRRDRKA